MGPVEAAAGGAGVLRCEGGFGGCGVAEWNGDEEDVALVEAGSGVFEFVQLSEEGRVFGAGGEEQEGAIGVAKLGEGGGGGWDLGRGDGHEEQREGEKAAHVE